ncbi:NAD(P)-binding protein [Aspergillus ellipticus CBS 707.79]|uniref:NAD(P)-binding protein n=1 Tax=Aspergillus ellipticus CBS 707.79 TaxID=1448320 RepID=A0A319D5Y3_9EURO|nr:NAD(P)-binding protein [Aspergillus ellipticus CBS 707.79]
MTGEHVLITGASGFIGFRVLVDTLKAGYRVRAAIRSPEKARQILATPSIKALNPGDRLAFVQVPDLEADGAYDDAIKGAQYAIHVASPIPSAKVEEDVNLLDHFVNPAVRGTLGLLIAAEKAGSVRRVVITSSCAAILPWEAIAAGDTQTVYNENSRVPSTTELGSLFEGYWASKVAALNEAEKWVALMNPSFDVIHLFPAYVIGRDELVTDVKYALNGSNQEVLVPVTGGDKRTPGLSVHVDDVAEAHVKCLDPSIAGNRSFVLACGGIQGTRWADSLEITARKFKKEIDSGLLRNNGHAVSGPLKMDVSAAETVLGIRFRSFEEQVTDVVSFYVELATA